MSIKPPGHLRNAGKYYKKQQNKGDIMTKPSAFGSEIKSLLVLFAIVFLIMSAAFLLPGCSTWGKEGSTLGNGKIDLPVDVSLEWHDNFGNGFVLVDGQLTEVTYKSVKTGAIYEYTETGGFVVTDPKTGAKIRIKLKELAPPAAETPPATPESTP